MLDDLLALRLQIEWGADEAIAETAADRFLPVPARDAPPSRAAPTRSESPSAPAPAVAKGAAARALEAAEAAPDLPALRAAFERFDGCPLRDTAGHFVFGDGPEDARLLVVAEAPDEADDASGRPLSGDPGRFLDRMLAHAGIERAACRVVCLVPWRPPGGRPPSAGEIAACAPFVDRHLRLLAFDHALLLGATVARALTGAAGTTRQLRGTWHALGTNGRTVQAMVAMPPAQIVADPKSKQNAWGDILMLRSKTGPLSSTSKDP